MSGLLTVLNTPYWISFLGISISSYQLFLYTVLYRAGSGPGLIPGENFGNFGPFSCNFEYLLCIFHSEFWEGFAPRTKKKCGKRATAPAPPTPPPPAPPPTQSKHTQR